jgi:hypothetical protein
MRAPFGNFGSTLGGSMGKVREREIILKTDQRDILLEMGLGGKFQTRSSGWDENRIFFEGDVREVEVCNGRWVLTRVPAGPRPAPPQAQHFFRPRSDGVTGYVTSSHAAATPLRYGVRPEISRCGRGRQSCTDRSLRQRRGSSSAVSG